MATIDFTQLNGGFDGEDYNDTEGLIEFALGVLAGQNGPGTATESLIAIGEGGERVELGGSFTYTQSGDLAGGTLNRVTTFKQDGSIADEWRDFTLDIQEALTLLQSAGGVRALYESILAGDTTINGSSFNDEIAGLGGNDTIDGGEGYDVALYTGTRDSFNISVQDGQVSITSLSGNEGNDSLSNVEEVQFGTRSYTVLSNSLGFNFVNLNVEEQLAAIYVGYFGRAADQGGRNFWVSEYETALQTRSVGTVLEDISESFRLDTEAQTLFPFLDPENAGSASQAEIEAFVDQVYENLFNRDPSAGGLAFWAGEIQARLNQGVNIGDIIIDIISGAQDGAQVDIDGDGTLETVNDATTILNKARISDAHADSRPNYDAGFATSIVGSVGFESSTVDAALSQIG